MDAAVRLNRAVWQIRRELNVDDDRALRMMPPEAASKRLVFFFNERNATLLVIRRAWPRLSIAECLQVARTVTQAASLSLNHAILGSSNQLRQAFPQPVKVPPWNKKKATAPPWTKPKL